MGSGLGATSGHAQELRTSLADIEAMLAELKVKYEQYFLGILTIEPSSDHQQLTRAFRTLRKAPFKNAAIAFHLRSLESRYHSYNSYWQRVLREREDGTYRRDIVKAELRDKRLKEESQSQTASSQVEKRMRELFESYRSAVATDPSASSTLSFSRFRETLVKTAKSWSAANPGKPVSFAIVSEGGRVLIRVVSPQ